MTMTLIPLLPICSVFFLLVQSAAQSGKCSTLNRDFQKCQTLDERSSLAWTIQEALKKNEDGVLQIAFSGTLSGESGWVAWGINPGELGMTGTNCLIAFQNSDGAQVYRYVLRSGVRENGDPLLPEEATEIPLEDPSVRIQGRSVTISARVPLKPPLKPNGTLLNHIWNWGDRVDGKSPQAHGFAPANLQSMKSIDVTSGKVVSKGLPPQQRQKNIHALLNGASWGIAIPLGVMSARYLRPLPSANPAWFYLHVVIQTFGYAAGVAGWVTGLKLGFESKADLDKRHGYIGHAIVAGGTFQVLALILRPHPESKIRFLWNMYHHLVGTTTLSLCLANVFIGLSMLKPDRQWRNIYISVLASLGGVSVIAEIINHVKYLKQKYLRIFAAAAPAAPPTEPREQKSVWDRLIGKATPAAPKGTEV